MASFGPLPFITVENDGEFKINPEAAAIIERISGRVVVLTIAGYYRTGKSFLLNALIARALKSGLTTTHNEISNEEKDRLSGFQVAGTVNACTKGIWMWAEPLQYRDATTILFLDTEGLNATRCENNHDIKLFSLLLLLSSTLIYNSRGTIDSHALEDLSLMLNISNHIRSNLESESSSEKASVYPSFIWVVRDFTLKLKDQSGFNITSREYLERALRSCNPATTSASQDCIRQALVEAFPRRNCVTMVRPVLQEEKLQKQIPRGDVRLEELRPEFLKDLDHLLQCIFDDGMEGNGVNGKNMDGSMYCDLVSIYVEAINNRNLLDVNNAWMRVVQGQCEKTVQESVVLYDQEMRKRITEKIFDESEILEVGESDKASLTRILDQTYGANFETIQNIMEQTDVEVLDCDPVNPSSHCAVELPSREEELASVHRFCKHLVRSYFFQTLESKCSSTECNKHYESLRLQMSNIYDSYCNDNALASMSYCRSLLQHLSKKRSVYFPNEETNREWTKEAKQFLHNHANQFQAQYNKYALGFSADAAYTEFINTQMIEELIQIKKKSARRHGTQLKSMQKEINDLTSQVGIARGEARTLERLFSLKQQSIKLAAKEQEQRHEHEIITLRQKLKYETTKLEHLLDHNATLKRMVEMAQDGQTRTAEYVSGTSVAKMAGYLLQGNVRATGGWEQIYLVVNDRILCSFRTKSDYLRAKPHSLGHNLIGARLKEDCLAPEAFEILFDQCQPLTFLAKSIKNKDQWITSLREAIMES
uniref:Guanylatebinding protein putative n=1 Tax=Albugo laibachii Nc14 TaxID=890382 RepID=F0WZS8_9STRA|nr:guanylatebinding protein putative [Albugo laibachii Nc14]|eukprot:CCA27005.1 guanylatebinding protein putative [Albugo laibachii Nc14]